MSLRCIRPTFLRRQYNLSKYSHNLFSSSILEAQFANIPEPKLIIELKEKLIPTFILPSSPPLTSTSNTPPGYSIPRIKLSQQLPIYTDFKNGGTRKLTLIRKIHGDFQVFCILLIYRLYIMTWFPSSLKAQK